MVAVRWTFENSKVCLLTEASNVYTLTRNMEEDQIARVVEATWLLLGRVGLVLCICYANNR